MTGLLKIWSAQTGFPFWLNLKYPKQYQQCSELTKALRTSETIEVQDIWDLFTFSTDSTGCLNSDCLWIIFCFDTGNTRALWMTTRQIYICPGTPQMQWGHQKLSVKWTHCRFKVKPRHIPLGVSIFIPQIVLNSPSAVKMYDIWCNLNLQDLHIQQYIKSVRIKFHLQSSYSGIIKKA